MGTNQPVIRVKEKRIVRSDAAFLFNSNRPRENGCGFAIRTSDSKACYELKNATLARERETGHVETGSEGLRPLCFEVTKQIKQF